MKFCYIDESGTGGQKIAVSVGIVVDAQRMHRTKEDWAELLDSLSQIAGRTIEELHTRDLYNGNSAWRGVPGRERADIISGIIEWLVQRKHKITFSAIDNSAFEKRKGICEICQDLKTSWCAASFHVALSVQKANQGHEKTKGHTVLVLDREVAEEQHFSKLISTPPEWSDSYYGRTAKDAPLSQIIDVPYFADSKQVLLIQVADLVAFILRRYAEIVDGGDTEKYDGELDRLTGWVRQIGSICYPASTRYLKRGRCSAGEVFFELAPTCLRNIEPGVT